MQPTGITIESPVAFRALISSRLFWVANGFLWLAFLTFFSYAQYRNAAAAELSYTWLDYFVMLAPWFLNFIWVTPMVFLVMHAALELPKKESLINRFVKPFTASLGILFCYWTVSLVMQIFIRNQSFEGFLGRLHNVVISTGVIDFVIYSGIFSAAVGAHFYHKAVNERLSIHQIQQELIQEQLKALRSQLNPHFLFNTLNTITSLVRLKKLDDAVLALSELSTMLRISLDNKQEETVSLREEMQFINSYLVIQKMRFADKLKIDIDIDTNCLNVRIPNMLLQPLVENAVQHGSQALGQQNTVALRIHNRNGCLVIKLTNHIADTDPHKGFGIGLNNTRKRLEKLYSDFQLELKPLNNGLFQTLLSLPSR